jgi:hypothetical protein
MRDKILLLIIFSLVLLPIISSSLGSFKLGDCVDIKTILNTSYVNLSTLNYPSGNLIISNQVMQNIAGKTFNYTTCNTSQLGTYNYDYFDADGNVYVNSFEITPSGFGTIGAGEGTSIAIAIIVMLIIAMVFIVGGFKFENIPLKVVFIGTGAVMLMACVLFSMVILMQVVGGFSSIISGFTTFWTVIKIITGLAILCLLIYSILFAWKLWMIKKGFRDD